MSANTFGTIYKTTTFGESHGGAVGCVIDGCPAKIRLDIAQIQLELDRRKPGQSKITTQRKEADQVQILSGMFEGKTLGTPICMLVHNKDANSQEYEYYQDKYRPSHGDFTYEKKFGIRAWAGGGRASARETAARVMAGAVAKQILQQKLDIKIIAYVDQVSNIHAHIDPHSVTFDQIEQNMVRCPDPKQAQKMIELINKTQKNGDSVGGRITCVIQNMPVGLGEPVFDKLDASLAQAMMSIPATKGFTIGSGFSACEMTGSKHNDAFIINSQGNITTKTNYSGGIQAGISNGQNIYMNIAFKPTPTLMLEQDSVDQQGHAIKLQNTKGRHDPCVVPRAVPIVESMAAITILDFVLRQQARQI